MSWADPLVIIPAGLLALLVLARLARLRPGLRPLVGPFALFVIVLSGLTLFAGGPLPASPWLALLFLPLHYAAGEKIIEEGSAGDSFFLVDRGEVRVLRRLGGRPARSPGSARASASARWRCSPASSARPPSWPAPTSTSS